MSFYDYLMRFKEPVAKDDITKLANLASQDTMFPRHSRSFSEISDYLELSANFYFDMRLFDEIWEQFEQLG